MKHLEVLTEDVKGATTMTKKVRGKLIIQDTEDRPEYIEVDDYEGFGDSSKKREEPIIRVSFADNYFWSGTMAQLKEKLTGNLFSK